MSIYKEASRKRIRFETKRGALTVEQLWNLAESELDSLAVELNKQYKESGSESFLTETTDGDKVLKLKFDVVLDVLRTKVDMAKAAQVKREADEHNRRIDELIVRKKNQEFEGLSIEELEKMRR